MENTRFDHLIRSLGTPSRRSILSAFMAAVSGSVLAAPSDDGAAAKGKQRRQRTPYRNRHRASDERVDAEKRKKKKKKKGTSPADTGATSPPVSPCPGERHCIERGGCIPLTHCCTDADCGDDRVCLANGSCASICPPDGNCPAGCLCSFPSTEQGVRRCVVTDISDCSQFPQTCTSTAQCPRGQQCQQSPSCGAESRCLQLCPCTSCPTGTTCLSNGTCAGRCDSNGGPDCPSGCVCSQHRSVEGDQRCVPLGTSCQQITQSCTRTVDCPQGQYCAVAFCGPNSSPVTRCVPLCSG